jgi:hypothetical protein
MAGGFTLTLGAATSITGGGTIALGGFTLTVAANSTINGSLVGSITGGGTLATGGFTLTVPATGTASLLGVAQTYSALKTYSAGLTFGQNTLNWYEEGTWTPTLAFGGLSAGLTYSSRTGYFIRIGNLVHLWASVVLSNKGTSNGTATMGTFPYAINSTASSNYVISVFYNIVTGTGAPAARISAGGTTPGMGFYNAGAYTALTDTGFANTSQVDFSITYRV